jgi:nitroimidazol reductase NimA-like FMN-containing flavoprotein (pyridoxamine 5'-phosphate oxidase superfamily)
LKINNFGPQNEIRFTEAERIFLLKNEVCRIATSHDDIPHVVPVSYICDKDTVTLVTDYGTRKYRNLKLNKNASVVVDIYDSIGGNKGIVIQGKAVLIERGKEYNRLYQLFNKRFEWVRKNPWKEGEAPFVKMSPFNKASWGLNE